MHISGNGRQRMESCTDLGGSWTGAFGYISFGCGLGGGGRAGFEGLGGGGAGFEGGGGAGFVW